MLNLNDIIKACKKQSPKAQKELYEHYSALFFAICLRYVKNNFDAEDVLSQSFFKIFKNIHQFSGQGSFEGWMKRIVVNENLMFLRKRKNFNLSLETEQIEIAENENIHANINFNEILSCLNELPEGYRTIFNLFVIEGYKHREIAELLNISINTSKSQLIHAKKKMLYLVKKKLNIKRAL